LEGIAGVLGSGGLPLLGKVSPKGDKASPYGILWLQGPYREWVRPQTLIWGIKCPYRCER